MPRTYTADQRNALGDPSHVTHVRCQIEDPDGVMQEVAGGAALFLEVEWFHGARWSGSADAATIEGTLTLWRYDADTGLSLSPEMGGSLANRNAANDYARFIELGRRVAWQTCVTAAGVVPAEIDFTPQFDGTIAHLSGEGTEYITLECHGKGSELVRTQIEVASEYGTEEGVLAETVLQQLINDTMGGGAPTLVTPASPGLYLTVWEQEPGPLMEALRTIALQIGQDIKYRWNAAHVMELQFFTPPRGVGVPFDTLTPDEYLFARPIEEDLGDIRNAVDVVYTDVDSGDEAVESFVDAVSVAKYGRLWAQVTREASDNIDTPGEALALATIIVNDLSEPWADHVLELPFYWLAEIGDTITLLANGVHYDSDQEFAVAAWEHVLAAGEGRTTLTMRGRAAGVYREWSGRIGRGPGGAIFPATLPLEMKNFRVKTRTPEEVTFHWDADPRIDTVASFEKTIIGNIDDDNPPYPATGSTAPPTRVAIGSPTEITIPTPDEGTTYAQIEPRTAAGTRGNYRRVVIRAALVPTVDGFAQLVGASGLYADLYAVLSDVEGLGGTLRAFVNHDSPTDADLTGEPDGIAAIHSTPVRVGPSLSFIVPGGASEPLLNNIVVHAGRGKTIGLEFVNSKGISSGIASYTMHSEGGVINANGELVDSALTTALQFAHTIRPPDVVDALPGAFTGNRFVVLTTTRLLYEWDAGLESYEPVSDVPTALFNTIVAGAVSAGVVDAIAIVAGAVEAMHISVAILSELSDDLGIIVAGSLDSIDGQTSINLNASGSDPVISHPAFTLYADGSAVFGGEVTASEFTSVAINIPGVINMYPGGSIESLIGITFDGVNPATLTTASGGIDLFIDANNQIGLSAVDISLSATGALNLDGGTVAIAGVNVTSISVGAANSGGAGFRQLLVDN